MSVSFDPRARREKKSVSFDPRREKTSGSLILRSALKKKMSHKGLEKNTSYKKGKANRQASLRGIAMTGFLQVQFYFSTQKEVQ